MTAALVEHVHLIRHALPVRLEQERPDPALSAFGHAQARALAAWWRGREVAGIATSDMLRAQQTAEPILETSGASVVVEPDLAEVELGIPFYLPITDVFLAGSHPELAWWRERVRDGDMEQAREEFERRAVEAFERVTALSSPHPLLVFTHGGAISAITRWILGIPTIDRGLHADYASVTTLRRTPHGGWTVVSFSETQHLAELGIPAQVDGISTET